MNCQIVSDIHLEFRGENFTNIIKPKAPILFLLGDICICSDESDWEVYKKFIKYLSPQFKYIFHVPGNHEYYTNSKDISINNTLPFIDKKIKLFIKTIPNAYFLNNNMVKLNINEKKYTIIGSTLWTNVLDKDKKYINSSMNDYSSIYFPNETNINQINWKPYRKYTVNDMIKLHIKSVKYILGVIRRSKKDENIILLTHHKPVRSKPLSDILSQAYETDLTNFIIKPPLKFAAHGHTHRKMDEVVNGVRIFSNPKGYPNQKTGYKSDIVIEL